MLTMDIMQQSHKYVNRLSYKLRAKRLMWMGVCFFAFKSTLPFSRLHQRWRVVLLKLFGAKIWKGIQVFPSCKIWAPWNLTTGKSVAIDDSVDLYNVDVIKIGHMVSISRRAFLCTASHDIQSLSRKLITKPIIINNGVWIGAQAYIAPGVTIGDGAVIAACAVVVKDVEPWSVVGGNPAKFIKNRSVNKEEWYHAFAMLEKEFKEG